MARSGSSPTRVALGLAFAQLVACGGGGGGSGSNDGPGVTTFIGRMHQSQQTALDSTRGVVRGAPPAVQVCVEGTSFCTEVDPTGAFTLAADVGGDVVLVFDGPNFTARLAVDDVPLGATVRIENIECSTVSGECAAEDVEIIDELNDPPDCSNAVASPSLLWPPNHQMVEIEVVGAVDPDGDSLVITAIDVDQDDAEDEPGSGNTSPDVQLDPLAVRAERSGRGDGRIYTISFVADDGRGGTCEGIVEVCVPHDMGNNSNCG